MTRTREPLAIASSPALPLLRRLGRDRSGNTLAIVAASMAPLLAIIGSGVDLGRSYLSETRLQQACDAGVLAARKQLGSSNATPGKPPAAVIAAGDKFFNLNYRDGAYGTKKRNFTMTLQADLSVDGVATVEVPTTVMNLFGFDKVDIDVECSAKLNYTNTDIMMVLDTTGSMNLLTAGVVRMTTLKSVVTNFHATLEAGKGPGTRIRYGFVPYSTNVNVGHLLKDEWVVSDWTYQSVENAHTESTPGTYSYNDNWSATTGSYQNGVVVSTYAATYHAAASETQAAYYSCDTSPPANTYTDTYDPVGSPVTTIYAGPPAGNKVTQRYKRTLNGSYFYVTRSGSTCTVRSDTYNSYSYEYDYNTIPYNYTTQYYRYAPISRNVASWRTETQGCMEERSTYEITDYDNVDFTKALDLDLDKVPTNYNERWRPMYPDIIRERALDWYGNGSFSTAELVTTNYYIFRPTQVSGATACPARARKLAEMDATQLASFLSTVTPAGYTYHDIGMIWGGRLISKTGLFAAENEDVPGKPTSRHLIFLTDGQTNTYDVAYGAYGVEPLDQRRLPANKMNQLDTTVEKRFGVACNEVKKRNVTVWVIGFDTSVSNLMKACAGTGKWFVANDAAQLTAAFDKIAASMGDLRISK